MKNIILCADDYGQNPAISQAIIELVMAKRLSAVSCLMNFPGQTEAANKLLPFKKDVAIGLHFNLTEGKPLSSELKQMFSLKELIALSQLRRLDKSMIKAELTAQLAQFNTTFGYLPDFVDGHQHVHQFPVIRDALLEVYETTLRPNQTYLRCTYNPKTLWQIFSTSYIKQMILLACGGYQFHQLLVEKNIPHNSSFSGIYNFSDKVAYDKLFSEFLNQVDSNGMIMCHPGFATETNNTDEIYASRPKEFDFLKSDAFLKLLATQNVTLVPKIY